uniref:Polysacc_synt_4 domain-containing protein n=1 Tax=Rhabditophanes sp. KR3021 TaxID=114890 RepID=A0AC35TU56_9BILA
MADLLTQFTSPAEEYVNDDQIELAWAIKASERATVHQNLLVNCDTMTLKLNKHQPEIYEQFRKTFPDFDIEQVTETTLKGTNKHLWHDYCELFKTTVDDYNLGSIMRVDATKIYSQENSIIVPRIQFLAIEGARNIEGVNAKYREQLVAEHKAGVENGTLAF